MKTYKLSFFETLVEVSFSEKEMSAYLKDKDADKIKTLIRDERIPGEWKLNTVYKDGSHQIQELKINSWFDSYDIM